MSLPDVVKRWGASITLGVMLGGLVGGVLLKTGVWVVEVNQHMAWGQGRSEEVKAQVEKIDRRQEWIIHVLYNLAAKAGVLMPALPAGISVTPPRPPQYPAGGLYAAEPDDILHPSPCPPRPNP